MLTDKQLSVSKLTFYMVKINIDSLSYFAEDM